MSIYKFLSEFKITTKNLKKYKSFQKVFRERTSKKLVNLMLSERFRGTFKPNHIELLERYSKFIKNDIVFIKYHQAKGLGRHYSDNDKSIITLPRVMKHTIMKYLGWIDIDMVSAHPNFACEVGKRAGREFRYIKQYLDNREQILQNIIDTFSLPENPITRDEAKSLFNIMAYGGGFNTWLNSDSGLDGKEIKDIKMGETYRFIMNYKRDCRDAKDLIYLNNPDIIDAVKGDLEVGCDELKRKVCSYFYGIIENEILFCLYKYLLDDNLIIDGEVSPEYDGLCFKPKEDVDYQEKVDVFSNQLFTENNFRVNFKVKAYDRVRQDIIDYLPNFEYDDSEIELSEEQEAECVEERLFTSYSSCKKWFEKTHFKVINLARYFKEVKNGNGDIEIICFDKSTLTTAYEHFYFKDIIINKDGVEIEKELPFVRNWFNDRNIRTYDIIDCYAPPLIPPANCYNIWKPFRMELLNIVIEDQDKQIVKEGVDVWINHIKILCGNNQEYTDWLLRWLGQALTFPGYKTTCPCFVSREGAGKGTLLKLLEKIMGKSKVFETTDPERDVIGHFNQLMTNAFIVNINEANANVLRAGGDGKIKGLITDTNLTINGKNEKPYVMKSYHRFMRSTNGENPLGTFTKSDDRRNAVIRSSDELIRNYDYFEKLNRLLEDDRVNYGVYLYLINLEGLSVFHREPILQTEYHSLIKGQNKELIQQFLEDYILEIRCDDPYNNPKSQHNGKVRITNNIFYSRFKKWFADKQIGEKSMSQQGFDTKIGLSQRNGIIPAGSIEKMVSADGIYKCFNIKDIMIHFGFDKMMEDELINNGR